ncbi:hypothetical protein SR39_09160 [Methylobacterium radiotolerans]|nr:hypothetical protein SR39_09160 [Methylobacterium radiotolerans]
MGRPRATSMAKLGPDRTATGVPDGRTCSATALMKLSLPRSIPLAQRMTGPAVARGPRRDSSTPRTVWAGTTRSVARAPARSAASPVARIAGWRGTPGR